MIKRLVIAEKPSVAMSIAGVLGVNARRDGYLENDAYLVSWCVGHLAELANADSYDERFPKRCVGIRPPYSEERRKAVSAWAKANEITPPQSKKE